MGQADLKPRTIRFVQFLLLCAYISGLTSCTFLKNYAKPPSENPALSSELENDLRCKNASTEIWNDAADTKSSHSLCRVNLGLIDANSVESAQKDSLTQAALVFMGNISQSNKEANDDASIDACEASRGESMIMIRMSVGSKEEVVFCRFSDGSILEGRTLFFGSLAPGYTALAELLD